MVWVRLGAVSYVRHRSSLAQDTIFSAFSGISKTFLQVMAKAMKKAAAPAAPAMKKAMRRAMKAMKK